MRRIMWLFAFVLAGLFGFAGGAPRQALAEPAKTMPAIQPPADQAFLRFVPDDHGGGRLQTATVRFKNDAGATVDLIAALHVADPAYYDSLNAAFTRYDALLYEMIKPRGMGAPIRGRHGDNVISGFQLMLKNALHLDYQLDDIDYSKANFIHADLDLEAFEQLQTQRGESIFSLMLRSVLHEYEMQAEGKGADSTMTLIDLLAALKAPDRPRQLKLLLARQFDQIEDQMAGLDGPNGSVIITDRNAKCFQVLKDELASGKRHIGIFFGAGHMHDMAKRLADLGFRPVATHWRVGWDMTAPPSSAPTATPPAATQPAGPTAPSGSGRSAPTEFGAAHA